MTSPQTSRRGYDPESAELRPRRCDNCGKRYTPKQKPRKGQRYGFCMPECKKQFHKHGAAYIQLKDAVEKFTQAEVARRFRLEEPCNMCDGKGWIKSGTSITGMKQSLSVECPKCLKGAVLTALGRDVLDLVGRRHAKA